MKTRTKTGEKSSSSSAATTKSSSRLASGRDTAASSRTLERLVRRHGDNHRRRRLRVRNRPQAVVDDQDHACRGRKGRDAEAGAAAEDVSRPVEDDAVELNELDRLRRVVVLNLAVDLACPLR